MDKTNIEYFNNHYRSFIKDIVSTFPEFKTVVQEYYNEFLESGDSNDDKHVKRFMRKIKDFKSQFGKKDESMFSESVFLIKNVDFKVIWESEELSESNKETIWDYLQTLFVLGETIISDSDKIKKMVQNFKTLRENSGKSNETSESTIDLDENDEMTQVIKNLSERATRQNTNDNDNNNSGGGLGINEDMLKNGMIGQLAQELSEEINIDSLNLNMDNTENIDDIFSNLISGDNPMKFMNLLQKVGSKIQDKVSSGGLDQSKLVEEATSMMGALTGGNPLLDNLMKMSGGLGGGGAVPPRNQQAATAQAANPHTGNSTRDRLKRKLEAKKNSQK
jgi:hypothetical protein